MGWKEGEKGRKGRRREKMYKMELCCVCFLNVGVALG